MAIELTGSHLGTQIYVRETATYSEKDLKDFLKDVRILDALRLLLDFLPNAQGEAPVPEIEEGNIADTAYYIMAHGSESGLKLLSREQVRHLTDICFSLSQERLLSEARGLELLQKTAYRQFPLQEDHLQLFARNSYLYLDLWKRCDLTSKIEVEKDIRDLIGVSYECALVLTLARLGNKHRYFFPYTINELASIAHYLGTPFVHEDEIAYLKWCSADYDYFRNLSVEPSPLISRPIIDTKQSPLEGMGTVYLLPSPTYLYRKLTHGIYFALADKHNLGEKKNAFKETFGKVFQEYVGELLKAYLRRQTVFPEIKYWKGRNQVDSSDWIITEGDKLLLIDVKQSSLTLRSRVSGKNTDVTNDLKKTLIKALKQLNETADAISSENHPELVMPIRPNEISGMIVVHEPIHVANHHIKALIEKECTPKLHYEIINISDLEKLLDAQAEKQDFFKVLADKKVDYREHAFPEFLAHYFPDRNAHVKFLKDKFDSFFKAFNEAEKPTDG